MASWVLAYKYTKGGFPVEKVKKPYSKTYSRLIKVNVKGHCCKYSHNAVNEGEVQPRLELFRPGPSTKLNETLCVQCILGTKKGYILKNLKLHFVF